MTAFISGHLDLTEDQFVLHYVPLLDAAIEATHRFVVGNARGADELALKYLRAKAVPSDRVTVYHKSGGSGQLTVADVENIGFSNIKRGWKSYSERDATMTSVSDYDIAWVRPDHETKILLESLGHRYVATRISGTQRNILRRSTR